MVVEPSAPDEPPRLHAPGGSAACHCAVVPICHLSLNRSFFPLFEVCRHGHGGRGVSPGRRSEGEVARCLAGPEGDYARHQGEPRLRALRKMLSTSSRPSLPPAAAGAQERVWDGRGPWRLPLADGQALSGAGRHSAWRRRRPAWPACTSCAALPLCCSGAEIVQCEEPGRLQAMVTTACCKQQAHQRHVTRSAPTSAAPTRPLHSTAPHRPACPPDSQPCPLSAQRKSALLPPTGLNMARHSTLQGCIQRMSCGRLLPLRLRFRRLAQRPRSRRGAPRLRQQGGKIA